MSLRKNKYFLSTPLELFSYAFVMLISASNGNFKAVPQTAERFGVQTHYYRLPMWPVMCVTKNVMVQQTLTWFGAYPEKQCVPWFGRDYWHSGRADNSNKTPNNAKYSNCKGLNHEAYDVSLQNLRSRQLWILSPLRILLLSLLRLFTSWAWFVLCIRYTLK